MYESTVYPQRRYADKPRMSYEHKLIWILFGVLMFFQGCANYFRVTRDISLDNRCDSLQDRCRDLQQQIIDMNERR